MNEMYTNLIRGITQQSVQIAVVFLIVAAAAWLLRNQSAHWRYMLWLVVLIKCVTPPAVSVPLAVLPVEPAPSSGIIQSTPREMDTSSVSPAAYMWATGGPSVETKGTMQHSSSVASRNLIASIEPVAPVKAESSADVLPAVPSSTFLYDHPAWNVSLLLALGWLAGIAVFGAYVLVRGWRICSHLRSCRHGVDDALRQEIASIAQTMGLKACPRAWLTDGYAQPFVLGFWRGSLYLPADFGELTLDARRQILAHELAHIVRCDAAINTLQILAQGLFFFHPMVWWANRQIRREREKCCDEIAIATRIVQPRQYTTAIVDALLRDRGPQRAMSTLAVAGPVKNLEERIKTILTPGRRFFRRPTWSAIVTVLLLAAVVAPTALTLTARAEENIPAEAIKAKTPKSDSKNPTVTLPNGISVELIAVNHNPAKPDGWWQPDGQPLNDATYTHIGEVFPSENDCAYEILYHVDAKGKADISTAYKFDQGGSSAGIGIRENKDIQGVAFTYPKTQETLSVSIGIATGNWKTEVEFSPDSSGSSSRGNMGFAYSEAIQNENNLTVMFSDSLEGNLNRRLVAIDTNGKLHTPGRYGMNSTGNVRLSSATFIKLKKEDVKEFQFQTRPYEWALFQNISLQPGKMQNVVACQTEEGNFQPQTKRQVAKTQTLAPVEATPSTEEDASVRAMLQKRIPKIELTDVRFSDAVDYMKEVSGLNIFVNFGQINQENNAQAGGGAPAMGMPGMMPPGAMPPGMMARGTRTSGSRSSRSSRTTQNEDAKKQQDSRDVQVSVDLSEVTIEDALRRILDSAAGVMGIQLAYVIDGSMLVISSQQGIAEMTPRLSESPSPVTTEVVGRGVAGRTSPGMPAGMMGGTPNPPSKVFTEEEKSVLTRLQKRVPKIELADVRFADAMVYMKEVSGLNFFVNFGQIDQELQNVRVSDYSDSRDVQITIDLKDVSLEDTLRRVLDAANGETGVGLSYTIDGSMVVVSTWDGIQTMTPRLAPAEKDTKPESK